MAIIFPLKTKKILLLPLMKGASSNGLGLRVIQDEATEFQILPIKHICTSLACGYVHYVAAIMVRKADFLACVIETLVC